MQKIVLIAEDDPATRIMVGSMVESIGLVPILCRDGQRAWDTFQDNPNISMLITDVQMPHMDGPTLIRQLRASPDKKGIPILIMSAVVGPKEIKGLLEMGVSAFLPKPVRREDIVDYISRNLDLEPVSLG